MGGTLLKGMTCSAYVAGVMAVGLKIAEIENSRPRVLRMIGTMAMGGDPFGDDMNRFNRIMNIGRRMSKRFVNEFGSTQCYEITQCDFSRMVDVMKYTESGCITRCAGIAERVAGMVGSLLEEVEPGREVSSGDDTESQIEASESEACKACPPNRLQNDDDRPIGDTLREGGVLCR
jgi:hypothetical protein